MLELILGVFGGITHFIVVLLLENEYGVPCQELSSGQWLRSDQQMHSTHCCRSGVHACFCLVDASSITDVHCTASPDEIYRATLFKSVKQQDICDAAGKNAWTKRKKEWIPARTETWRIKLFMCYPLSSRQPSCSQSGWLVKYVWGEPLWALNR